MTKEKYVTYRHRAPFYSMNELTGSTRRVWLVFHGYGQLSRFFVRKFDGLDKKQNFILAPQGLSKYYLKGFEGRVGANWMTKEDRLTDIANQYAYIDAVLDQEPVDWEKVTLVYFGFSQGVATMGRYAAYSGRPFSTMVVWAGAFPPELTSEDFHFRSGAEHFRCFIGDEDPFFTPGKENEQKQHLEAVFLQKIEITRFEGAHELRADLISEI